MANSLTFKINIDDGGTMTLVASKSKKAADGLKAVDKAATGAAKSSSDYNKQAKGVGQAGLSNAKGFSKMTSGIQGGLVPAYATLAAHVFAVSAAFGLLSRNDAITKLAQGLEYTGNAAGQNLGMVSDKLKEITGNAVSAEAAMRATAVGISSGFSQSQLEDLTKVAKGASLALGRDMGDAMDRLIRGTAKLEPEILDELGIMVRLDDAVKNYADSVNKSVKDLTQFERRMGFTNAVIAQGLDKFADISAVLDASAYSQLNAAFADFTKTGITMLNSFLTPVMSFLAANSLALTGIVLAFAASISGPLLSSIEDLSQSASRSANATAFMADEMKKGIKPIDGMSKGYNKLAAAAGRTDAELKEMLRRVKLSANLMGKDNIALKDTIKQRGELGKMIQLNNLGINAEASSKAVAMIATHGLSAAWTEHGIIMARNKAQTAASVIGQDAFTSAIMRSRAALFLFGATARMVGATVVAALPWLFGLFAILSIVGPMLASLFKEEENKLTKQIEENTTRLNKYVDVVHQYNKSILTAKTATEAWYKTIKPLAGLFEQTVSAMRDTGSAADLDVLIKRGDAWSRVAEATQKLNDARARSAKATGPAASVAAAASVFLLEGALVDAQRALKDVSQTEADLTSIRTESARSVQTLIRSMDQMLETLEADESKTVLNAEAVTELTGARETAIAVLTKLVGQGNLSREDLEKQATAIQQTAQKLKTATDAYETFNEIVSKANTLTSVSTFGLFADEIDNVTNAMNAMNAMSKGTGAQQESAIQIVKKYGLEIKKVNGEAIQRPFNTPLIPEVDEAAIHTVERFKNALEALNEAEKQFTKDTASAAGRIALLGSDNLTNIEKEIKLAKVNLGLKEETLRLTVKGGEDEETAILAIIDAETKLIEVRNKKYNQLSQNAKAAGMGEGAAGAIAGMAATGAIRAREANTPEEELQKAKDLSEAMTQQRKLTMSGIAADMANMGPEGALMSATINGIQNMETAFTTAQAVMADSSSSTADRIQAGLGVAMAAMNALSSMTAAHSANKIRGIDQEIAAEKARDGKSAGSVAKLEALEKKKTAAKRKAFEIDKKMKMAQTVIGTAQAVVSMLGSAPPPFNFILAGLVGALGAAQLAMISGTSFQGGGGAGGSVSTPASVAVGNRQNSVDLATARSPSGELAYARGAQGTGQGMTNFTPTGAFAGTRYRASGGNTAFMVGEQGPELFTPEMPGRISPADDSSMGGGAPVNVTFTINAIDSRGIEEVLNSQRGNLVGIIREAANAHGESFLENVNVESYQGSAGGYDAFSKYPKGAVRNQ